MSAQRRSTGRSPVMQRGGAAAAASRARGGVLGGSSGGSTHHGSGDWLWVKRVAAASLALIGCFLVVMFVAPGTPSSSLSSSSSKAGAAAALMSRLRGNNKMEGSQEDHHQQQQQLALLNAYCEAPLGAQSLEGAAHLPLPPQSRAKLRQLQVVIRHGDRSPISSLTTPPPLFSCKLRDPAMVRLAQLMKAEGKDAPFRIVGMGGTATRAYLATNLLPEGKEAGEEEQACFPGQLTERGFRQQVANGRFLRERYAEALGPITDPSGWRRGGGRWS